MSEVAESLRFVLCRQNGLEMLAGICRTENLRERM